MLEHIKKIKNKKLVKIYNCKQFNQGRFEKYFCLFVWLILFFESSSDSTLLTQDHLNKKKKCFEKIFNLLKEMS